MKNETLLTTAATAGVVGATIAHAADAAAINDLVAKIKSPQDAVRGRMLRAEIDRVIPDVSHARHPSRNSPRARCAA